MSDYLDKIKEYKLAPILSKIKEHILEKTILHSSMDCLFFEVMEKEAEKLENLDFIRYLNIFNRAEKGSAGHLEFYADFIHGKDKPLSEGKKRITADRNEIDIGQGNSTITTGYTIGNLFFKCRKFGNTFEYSKKDSSETETIEESFFVVKEGTNREFSDDLNNLIQEYNENYAESGEDFKAGFNKWLDSLDVSYDENNEVTHFFFINGPVYYGRDDKLEKDLEKYVVSANLGIRIKGVGNEWNCMYEFLQKFKSFIEQLSFNLLVDVKDYQMRQAAVRASIAQVMARNMSHNFGSHVLSNLIGDHVYEKLKDDEVKKEFEKIQRYMPLADVFKDDKDRQLPFFFQYLKSRMDYLSEVTFGVSNLLTTKMMFNDVMKELDQVRILLNYISGVSNFKYKFSLIYKDVDEDIDLTKKDVIGVAFPSDVLGCQAFYNIIENIIRNTAKHAKNNNDETVVFTITIKDNFAKEAGCEKIEGVDELYCVEIDNGVEEEGIDIIVNGTTKKDGQGNTIKIKGQNDRLNDSVLDTSNNLRSHSLGLLEMEASAAFLRQIDLPEIESDNYYVDKDNSYYHERNGKKRLNILKAFAIKENDTDTSGRLGYRFFLQKPKEFLFVGNWKICELEEEDEENVKKQLLNCGIQYITDNKFCNAMKSEKALSHQFLIYQEDISKEAKGYLNSDNDCKTLLPLRRLSISNKEWETISKEWHKLAQQDDKQNKSDEQKKKLNGKDNLLQLKKWAWEKYIGNADDIIICSHAYYSHDEAQKQQIVFLDHGENYEAERGKRDRIKKEGGNAWIENLSSRTWGKLPGFIDLSKTGGRETQLKNYISNIEDIAEIKAEIFESYHYRVVVLDERIQKFSNENSEGSSKDTTIKIPCSQLFETTDVLIPDTPLDPNSFSKENVEELERFVASNITTDAFVLVHYGVLERMYGEINLIDGTLMEWATKARRVVVTSGRGAHSLKLPKNVCFVNLSSALYAFCENRNKYIINNLLNQSRRKRNE